jgi:hypothetical protein
MKTERHLRVNGGIKQPSHQYNIFSQKSDPENKRVASFVCEVILIRLVISPMKYV